MIPETKAERWALYAQLRDERYGPLRRLRRERHPSRPLGEDPGVLMRRLRILMAADDEAV
jgi:hypothetical protein